MTAYEVRRELLLRARRARVAWLMARRIDPWDGDGDIAHWYGVQMAYRNAARLLRGCSR